MESVVELVTREHRQLDDLLGRFFGAAHAGSLEGAREAMRDFDAELRRHTAFEEETLLPQPTGQKLVPSADEPERERLTRELRLEHVQVRELSAMMRRQLEEQGDLKGAERLAGNLARRWDAHTVREEEALARLGV